MESKVITKPKQIRKQSNKTPELSKILFDSMGLSKETASFMAEKMTKAGMDDINNGAFVEKSVHISQKKYTQILRRRLTVEYDAESISELMLIDVAISAYFRYLQSSMLYNSYAMDAEGNASFNQLKVNITKELGKQIDQSHRQFISALATLREMKRPALNLKIHSRQAFIAENQQFNKNA